MASRAFDKQDSFGDRKLTMWSTLSRSQTAETRQTLADQRRKALKARLADHFAVQGMSGIQSCAMPCFEVSIEPASSKHQSWHDTRTNRGIHIIGG
jgi:hypothetical protein